MRIPQRVPRFLMSNANLYNANGMKNSRKLFFPIFTIVFVGIRAIIPNTYELQEDGVYLDSEGPHGPIIHDFK